MTNNELKDSDLKQVAGGNNSGVIKLMKYENTYMPVDDKFKCCQCGKPLKKGDSCIRYKFGDPDDYRKTYGDFTCTSEECFEKEIQFLKSGIVI